MDTEAGPGKDAVRSDGGECIVVGIGLEQKTGSLRAENLQNLTFWKSKSDHVDLLRGSAAATTTATTTNADVRATFTCPVMSRRHARIIFTGNGTVTITDLGSLHGTFVKSNDIVTKLVPNKPHTLMSEDLITLGKSVNRDDRQWEPVSLQVRLITEDSAPAKDVVAIDALSPGATDSRSSPSLHTLPKSDPQPASTNRFGFYPSSETSSSEMSTSDIDEDDAHSDEDDNEPRVAPDGASSPPVGTPISDRLWSTLPIFCGVMRRAKTRSPLPSIHQLGLSSSLLNSFSGNQAPSLPHCNTDDFSADVSNMSSNTNSSPNTIGHVTQNIIDLTAVDEIPFPSSILENQLGVPIEQFGTASHLNVGSGMTAGAADSVTSPSNRVVYDSDGNELSDGEGDDDEDGKNLDELDDEEEQDGDYVPDEGWNEEDEDEEGEDDEDGEGDEDDDEDKDEDEEDEDEDEEDEDEEDYESHRSGASSPMQISSGAPSANATRASSPEFPPHNLPPINTGGAFSWNPPRTVPPPPWTTPQWSSMTNTPVVGPGNGGPELYYDYSGAGGNVVNGGVSNGGQMHAGMNGGVNTSGSLGGQMNGSVYENLYASSSGWNTATQTTAAQLAPPSYPIPSTLPPLSTYHRPTNVGYGYFAPPSTPAVMNEPQRLTPPTSHPMAIVAPATGRSASDSSVTVSSAPAATATTTTPYVTTPYVGCVGGVQNTPTQVNSVKLIEDSRSSLFSQEVVNGNEDENNSGGQQQAQTENQADQGQYDRASRAARIVSQISALSTRLGRPAVEAQIKAGVSRLFWGESVQERAANAARQKKEEEEKEMKRKEEEMKRKEEIRSIMREELTRTSNNLEARFDDGVLEVLAKLDNPLPIRVNGDQSVQTDPLQEKEVQLRTPEMDVDDDNHECVSASPLSRKRKRSEVEAEEEASTASSSDVESNSTSTLTVVSTATQTEPPPSPAALVSNDTEPCTGTVTETRTETSVDPSPRPGKRMRFWRRRSTNLGSDEKQRKNEMTTKRRSFTSAAGLVSLGVVATYAVLANVSEEWIDRMAERYV